MPTAEPHPPRTTPRPERHLRAVDERPRPDRAARETAVQQVRAARRRLDGGRFAHLRRSYD